MMKMAELPGIAVREDEIELDLGLSIGGSFRKSPEKSISRDSGGCTDLSHCRVDMLRACTSGSQWTLASDGDNESAVMEQRERREIHALRRREAKRKREEKQQRRGRSFGFRNEEVVDEHRRPLKKEKLEDGGSECNVMKNVDLNFSDDQVDSRDHRTNASQPKQDHAAQMPHSFPPSQFGAYVNGYVFPYAMPYWPTGAATNQGHENRVHQPVASRSFRPFQMNQNTIDVSLSNGCQFEQNGSKEGRNRKAASYGSPVCSSSVVSDNYQSSSSHEGCSSSYTISNSSISSPTRHHLTGPNSNATDDMNNHPSSLNHKPKPCSDTHVCKASTVGIKEEVIEPSKHEAPSNSPLLVKCNPTSPKRTKMENGKPPKPQIQSRSVPSVEQMPCVSTTGIGPDGRTITGFLYRYSKSEVSILCVCHGKSFTPAEFVKHAGGEEVSHPLRHITVLPTANGIPSVSS